MADNELISIVIPVYNVEKYINRCLESVISQTYKNLEIILVDDGSTDNSGKICDEYAIKDSRIKVIHKQNEGLGLTRNAGMEQATGKYIGFLDSDDYVELTMYETMYRNIKEEDFDAVLCSYKRIDKNKEMTHNATNLQDAKYRYEEIQKDILLSICGNPDYNMTIGSVCCGLYKRQIIQNNNITFLNERDYVSEDIIFNYMFFAKCNYIKLIKDDLYIYCENDGSLTKTYNPAKIKKFANLYKLLKEKIVSYKEESYIGLDTLYIGYMRVAIIQEIEMNPNKKEIKSNIKNICNDYLLCEILKKYNVKKISIKQKIFTIFMKYKLIGLLILSVKIK